MRVVGHEIFTQQMKEQNGTTNKSIHGSIQKGERVEVMEDKKDADRGD